MFDLLLKGGPILWVILALFLPLLAILLERGWYFARLRGDEDRLLERVQAALDRGHAQEALAICDTVEAPVAALIRAAVEHRDRRDDELREAVRDAAVAEIPQIERNIAGLQVIGNIAPLLGLLGTVSGIISSFNVLGNVGGADPSALARGISEALLTTAAGIVVAVPAIVAYAWLAGRANALIGRLEGQANDLVRRVRRAG